MRKTMLAFCAVAMTIGVAPAHAYSFGDFWSWLSMGPRIDPNGAERGPGLDPLG